jgi:hypothetical protein
MVKTSQGRWCKFILTFQWRWDLHNEQWLLLLQGARSVRSASLQLIQGDISVRAQMVIDDE